MQPKPTILLILDGWGCREATDDNAITRANTPVWDRLWAEYPHTRMNTSGMAVGLPDGQMGNSEVGHMNLGAGRVVYQEFTRISKAIDEGEFFTNPALCTTIDAAVARGGAVHIMGLLSPGGVHSHEQHLFATLKLAAQRGAEHIYVHAFLDGRDTPPRSAADSIAALEAQCAELGRGQIASIVGRYYAMDRDQRWDRVRLAYRLITEGEGEYQADTAAEGLEQAYARDENDEFVKPTAISPPGADPVIVADGDCVLFVNFRSDRAREMTRALVEPDFDGFTRPRPIDLAGFVCMTQYQDTIDAAVAFPPVDLHQGLGEILAANGKSQLRLAETEKYAHVTFFFNGGRETVFDGEERILVPSPKVATYDLQPEMSAAGVTEALVDAVKNSQFDVIICNYANPDMVGHSGLIDAAVKAVETVDQCLGEVYEAVKAVGGEMLVTSDHGNAEQMRDLETHQAHTAHTLNQVPLVYVGRPAQFVGVGALCDIAPTILYLLQLSQPSAMTGRSLLQLS